ncbi:MAG TPA: thiamine pyrophosphate-dependent enzyme, partial [Streptosporangiaceae bacterium]
AAVDRAARGDGPTLIEALTYRMEAHTNADDATRYRDRDEVTAWLGRDPLTRLEAYLRATGELDDAGAGRLQAEAEAFAAALRERMNADTPVDPADLFAHVYAEPTAALIEQRRSLFGELREAAEEMP